jgi:hypothetical protein
VIYARILDGETLWLAVTGAVSETSRLALRYQATGDLIRIPTESILTGDNMVLTTRFVLTGEDSQLPASGGVVFTVVVTAPHLDEPLNTWSRVAPGEGPTRAPRSRDGRWQFKVLVVDDELRIIRESRPEWATAFGFWRTDSAVGFRLSAPEAVEPVLLILAADLSVLHEQTLDADDGEFTALLGGDVIPDAPGTMCPLAIGTPAVHVPVMRRRNDLRNPNFAVSLPAIPRLDSSGPPLFRLRWLPTGQLALARPLEEESATGDFTSREGPTP